MTLSKKTIQELLEKAKPERFIIHTDNEYADADIMVQAFDLAQTALHALDRVEELERERKEHSRFIAILLNKLGGEARITVDDYCDSAYWPMIERRDDPATGDCLIKLVK